MACSITTRKEEMIRLSSFSSFNRGFFLVPFFGISTLGYSLAKPWKPVSAHLPTASGILSTALSTILLSCLRPDLVGGRKRIFFFFSEKMTFFFVLGFFFSVYRFFFFFFFFCLFVFF